MLIRSAVGASQSLLHVVFAFVVAALAASFSFGVSAAYASHPIASGTCGADASWELSDDGVVVISGSGNVDGHSDSSKLSWYDYRDQIRTVVIERGITAIGESAFFSAPNLNTVVMSDTVTHLGDTCFSNTPVENITFSKNLISIGGNAFAHCGNIRDIELPDSLQMIDIGAFGSCSSLRSISIPKNVKIINSVEVPFQYCPSLETISVDDGNPAFGDVDGILISKKTKTIIRCPQNTSITEFTIPDGIQAVGHQAFWENKNIQAIACDSELLELEEDAFYGCESLSNVVFNNSLESIGARCFYSDSNITSITLPDSISEIGEWAFYGCTKLSSINIPANIVEIPPSFARNTSIDKIEIPAGVQRICGESFEDCVKLARVRIPASVKSIGGYAFSGCTSLSRIEMLSHDCDLSGEAIFYPLATIYSLAGSTAKEYADDNDMDFVIYRCETHAYGEWTVTKRATCTEAGSREKVCADCGDKVTEAIDAAGHSWNEGAISKAATYDAAGIRTYACGNCGQARTEAIPKLARTSLSKAAVSVPAKFAYTGKKIVPNPTVKVGGKTLAKGVDYLVSYSTNVNVGKVTVTVAGKGAYMGSKRATFTITQAANKATAKSKSVKKTVKLADLKKKAQTVALPKVTTKFGKAKWKATAKDKKKVLTLKNGKVQVKKGAKAGTYTIKLKANVAKTKNYKAANTKIVTVKVTVASGKAKTSGKLAAAKL